MHKLSALTPLGGSAPRIDEFSNLSIKENPNRALASVAARLGQEAECVGAAKGFLGFDLPEQGQSHETDEFCAFWIGPDSWIVDADHDTHELLASQLKLALGGAASVVEQTDAWCRFDLQGTRICDLLERLCNVDVRAMSNGSVSRCAIHHIGCFVWSRRQDDVVTIIGPRSSAKSLHHALVETAVSIGA